ncbi:hypothetical protein C8Q73DRAFT_242899 [Cubamyces lactineus]|nr:hypothetical protein C8Q73DRAFT_242899 [Cubamyces lactineus]
MCYLMDVAVGKREKGEQVEMGRSREGGNGLPTQPVVGCTNKGAVDSPPSSIFSSSPSSSFPSLQTQHQLLSVVSLLYFSTRPFVQLCAACRSTAFLPPMAARPGFNQPPMNPFSNQPQYARQYSHDSDADSYTSRNASSVPLATSGYYDGSYTPQCKFAPQSGRSPPKVAPSIPHHCSMERVPSFPETGHRPRRSPGYTTICWSQQPPTCTLPTDPSTTPHRRSPSLSTLTMPLPLTSLLGGRLLSLTNEYPY